jgi:hypothetical protein
MLAPQALRLPLLGFLFAALLGCGQSPFMGAAGSSSGPGSPTPSQGCKPNSVEILVGDTYLQELCGCSNIVNGTVFAPGTAFSCTGPAPVVGTPTVFFFHFLGRSIRHQIVSTGTPTFSGSPIYDPANPSSFRIFGVPITATGTYGFRDSLNTALFGAITL